MSKVGQYIWGMVGNILPQALHLLGVIVLARILTPADFGIVGVLGVFISVAGVLIDTGLGGSLVKEKSLSASDCASVSVFNVGVSTLLYMAIFFAAPYIERFYALEGLTTITRVLSLTFIIGAFGLVPRCMLVRELKFKQIGLLSVFSVVVASVLAILAALAGWRAYSLVVYQLVNTAISTIGAMAMSRYLFSVRFRGSDLKRHLSFGVLTTLANVVDIVYDNILIIITGKIATVSQVGYMSQSKKIQEVSTNGIATSVNNVAFPLLTKHRDEREKFIDESDQLVSTIGLLLFPLLVVMAVAAEYIILIVFGEQWIAATPYLSAFMVAGVFIILERLVRNFIKSLLFARQLLTITFVQRIVGLAVIVTLTLVRSEWLIASYVAASVVIWIISSASYARLVAVPVLTQLAKQIRTLLPSAGLYALLYATVVLTENIVVQASVAALLLGLYYFVLLPKYYSISLYKTISGYLNRRGN